VQHANNLLVIVERMPSRRICLAVGEGTSLPLSEAASGKVLLSRMPDVAVKAILESDPFYREASATKRRAILDEIAQGRRDGLLLATSEITPGVTDIAVPVGVAGSDTDAIVDMSFILPSKGSDKVCEQYAKAMRQCAARINQNLGVSAP
jgi:DNA-binding IclR family transcriptional regulator